MEIVINSELFGNCKICNNPVYSSDGTKKENNLFLHNESCKDAYIDKSFEKEIYKKVQTLHNFNLKLLANSLSIKPEIIEMVDNDFWDLI